MRRSRKNKQVAVCIFDLSFGDLNILFFIQHDDTREGQASTWSWRFMDTKHGVTEGCIPFCWFDASYLLMITLRRKKNKSMANSNQTRATMYQSL